MAAPQNRVVAPVEHRGTRLTVAVGALLIALGGALGFVAALVVVGGDEEPTQDTAIGPDADTDDRSGDPGAGPPPDGDDGNGTEDFAVSPAAADASLWLTSDELAALPTEGEAWDGLVAYAEEDWDDFDLDDNDGTHDVHTLAGALVAARTGDAELLDRVREALDDVPEADVGDLLPLARNLSGYVIAADLIGYRTEEFESWLEDVLDEEYDGRADIESLRQSALTDPSNHGAHARATTLAIALYLGDEELESTVAERFHDWLGRSSEGFVWKELWWQADPDEPVGINPPGAEIEGLSVDGVLPEEQRRSGEFTTDPEREGYVWEALQGAVVTAELLERSGHPAWEWQDQAILRAFEWLHEVNDFPARGDDEWQPWVVNPRYGTDFPTDVPTMPGKNMGFTEWTHGEREVTE